MGVILKYFLSVLALVVVAFVLNYKLFCVSMNDSPMFGRGFRGSSDNDLQRSDLAPVDTSPRTCTQPERQRAMAKACRGYPQLSNVTRDRRDGYHVFRNFIVDEKHKLLLCSIHKAGSSTLLRMLIWGTGKLGEQNNRTRFDRFNQTFLESIGINRLSSYPIKRQQEILNTYVKIINIRNPMTRLVSAYRDKFIKLRNGLLEIIGHVMKNYRNIKGATDAQILEESVKSPRLSLREFARLVMDQTAPYDLHWDTMIHHCYPCLIKYDYIIRQETMDDDMAFMLKLLSTELKRKLELEVWHSTNDVKLVDETKLPGFSNLVPDLAALPITALDALRTFYRQDMEVFGYNFNSQAHAAECGYDLEDGGRCC